jgi:hypothetical protein
MIRFAALLVAASVLAVSLPAQADGIPLEKRPTMTKKIKKKRIVRKKVVIEKKIVVEKREAPPLAIMPTPPSPPPAYVWMPGHWTWNAPMNMHVWVPGMYVWPTSPAEEQSLALWRLGKWIGIGRDD